MAVKLKTKDFAAAQCRSVNTEQPYDFAYDIKFELRLPKKSCIYVENKYVSKIFIKRRNQLNAMNQRRILHATVLWNAVNLIYLSQQVKNEQVNRI